MPLSSGGRAVDPFDPDLSSPFDHGAWLRTDETWTEWWHGGECVDTGLRCEVCGREVTVDEDSPTGWSHVGVGDKNDPSGRLEWERTVRGAA